MELKTILNRVEPMRSFVYGNARFEDDALVVPISPRSNGSPLCSVCGCAGAVYDKSPSARRFQYVPLWGLEVWFEYTMRRVKCEQCGVKVERVPWAEGKSPVTTSFSIFLAAWAKRMSWKEVAQAFNTSWECVFRAVQVVVAWGLARRDLTEIKSIGIDEVMWHRGHKYLTVVYEIASGRRRLLWIGEDRKEATLQGFFDWFGDRARGLEFVCSDMWQPYLKVLAARAAQAIHILDRYHIVANLNKAIDNIRAGEVKQLKADGYEPMLKRTRWLFLKRPENLTSNQASTLGELLKYNLRTVKAYLLAQELDRLWSYVHPTWAGKFLDQWCRNVMRTRLEPMKKFAASMRTHRPLILNWFRARGEISAGCVEGLNNKLKLTLRKSYGFRTFPAAEVALYHALGRLPEPPTHHRFC